MESIKNKVLSYIKRIHKPLLLLTLLISVFALVMIKSAQRAYYTNYFKTQLAAVLIGYAVAFVITLIDYREYGNFWYLIGGFCVFIMLYTLAFATSVSSSGGVDARAWINIGGRTFQPSELVKIGFMVTFAKHISIVKENGKLTRFFHVALLGLHALIPMILCHLQGDDGAGMIFFCMFLMMAFGAGVQLRYFLGILGAIVIAVPLAWKLGILEEYQKTRFTAVFHLDDPAFDSDMIDQQVQGRTSIGSGGLTGQGLFNGPRTTAGTVPFQHSDYIYSTIGEELGFFGCVFVLLLLLALLGLTLRIALSARDTEGSVICFGFFGLIASQSIINIGMCLALLPVMGVTLPFFSAGGSSAMCLYFGLGLIQNVWIHNGRGERTMLRKNYAPTGFVG